MSTKRMSPSELARKVGKIRLVVFDFDGVFTDNTVIVSQNGEEAVVCNRADGLGLEMLRASGVEAMVLSSEVNQVVSARCRKLNLRCIQCCNDKRTVLKAVIKAGGIKMAHVAYVGNDRNDLACMEIVGLAAAVADASPDIISIAHYVIARKGGMGAVREFCEFVCNAKKASQS